MYEPPKIRKCGLYWPVEQLVADCIACIRFVMNETIQKPVVRNHLNHVQKIMRTLSLTPAAAESKNVRIATTQMDRNGEHGSAASHDGEESTVGELEG
jgi:hypothetical protein